MSKLKCLVFVLLGGLFSIIVMMGVYLLIDGSQEMFPTQEQIEKTRIFAIVVLAVSLPPAVFFFYKAVKLWRKE